MFFEGGGGVWGDFPVADVSFSGQKLVRELFFASNDNDTSALEGK